MKQEAKAILSAAGIALGQHFNSLDSSQFAVVRTEAATAYLRKHRKPMPDDSETYIRKRYDLLQSRAQF